MSPGAWLFALLLPLTVAASPDPDTVRVGCLGGRTGAASGHTISRDGALMKYQDPFHSRAVPTFLRRDAASADSVFAALARIRFRSLRFHAVSNMTCVLEVKDREGKHTVSWPSRQPPAALEPALAALERAFAGDSRGWP